MPFRHDAGVFRPNGVSRRNFDGLKTPNPSSVGHWVCLGKKVVGKNPNGVSAKCAIVGLQRAEKPLCSIHSRADRELFPWPAYYLVCLAHQQPPPPPGAASALVTPHPRCSASQSLLLPSLPSRAEQTQLSFSTSESFSSPHIEPVWPSLGAHRARRIGWGNSVLKKTTNCLSAPSD
jgi:hypothetical protein